jgi:hypothetical protein
MSGHWRFCVAAFLFIAGLSISPASSNPLTDLFNVTPQEAAAPAPAQAECVQQPGRPTPGQHWVYRLDGHRKCWYQADEARVAVKQIHHHTVRRAAIARDMAREENEAAPRKKMVLDAQAQLLSATPAAAPQSTASESEAVDTVPAPVPAREAAPPVLAAPIAAQPTIDPPTPNRAAPRSVDVEALLAAAAPDKDMATSAVPSATPDAPSVTGANDWESTAARGGTLLIALGFVFLAGSILASRFFDQRDTDSPGEGVDRDGATPVVARQNRLLSRATDDVSAWSHGTKPLAR